ncbi:MAG: hypothetical protein KBF17_11710, partial [Candidatus Promineofilum sp.]|nr:hypothetical protein [Promineifilum sp.]
MQLVCRNLGRIRAGLWSKLLASLPITLIGKRKDWAQILDMIDLSKNPIKELNMHPSLQLYNSL